MRIDALSVLCAQLTRDLLAIAKFLFVWTQPIAETKLRTERSLNPMLIADFAVFRCLFLKQQKVKRFLLIKTLKL